MAYNVDDTILTVKQAPTDAKILVGTGQYYASKEALADDAANVLKAGMKVTEVDKKLTYIWNGIVWVQESFGVDIRGYLSSGQTNIISGSTFGISLNTPMILEAITFGNIKSISWTIEDSTPDYSEKGYIPNVQWTSGQGTKAITATVVDNFGNSTHQTVTASLSGGGGDEMIYGVETGQEEGGNIRIYDGVTDAEAAHALTVSTQTAVVMDYISPTSIAVPWGSTYGSVAPCLPWILIPAVHEDYKTCLIGAGDLATKAYVTEADGVAATPPSENFWFIKGDVSVGGVEYTFYKIIGGSDDWGTTGITPSNITLYTYSNISSIVT